MKITNNIISVETTLLGGELTSITFDGKEVLYQMEGSWKFQDHVLFPLIGPADNYACHGEIHSTTRHGFVRNYNMVETKNSESKMTLSLTDNEEIFKVYPYHFTFKEIISLNKNEMTRRYEVSNNGTEILPFEIGGHPAFYCDYSKARIVMPDSFSYLPEPCDEKTLIKHPQGGEIKLNKKDFFQGLDCIIIPNPGTPIILYNGRGEKIEFHYAAPYITLWTPKTEEDCFLCVEPYWGLPKTINDPNELIDRPLYTKLEPGKVAVFEDKLIISKE